MGGVDNATTYYYGRSNLCDTWMKRRGSPSGNTKCTAERDKPWTGKLQAVGIRIRQGAGMAV